MILTCIKIKIQSAIQVTKKNTENSPIKNLNTSYLHEFLKTST